uniref:Uncharacterized protein n=1 Tax=Knipowitschia caucasica TaxID=637954 RepID=A0AAV2MLB6_KNICA
MPSLHQYVDIPTRKQNTLDLCYGNISDAFVARAHAPLGFSDHNVVLIPHYLTGLKRAKPTIHSASVWSEDAIAQLQGCLACTDWDVFQGDLDNKSTALPSVKSCSVPCPWTPHHSPHLRRGMYTYNLAENSAVRGEEGCSGGGFMIKKCNITQQALNVNKSSQERESVE